MMVPMGQPLLWVNILWIAAFRAGRKGTRRVAWGIASCPGVISRVSGISQHIMMTTGNDLNGDAWEIPYRKNQETIVFPIRKVGFPA